MNKNENDGSGLLGLALAVGGLIVGGILVKGLARSVGSNKQKAEKEEALDEQKPQRTTNRRSFEPSFEPIAYRDLD